MSRRKREREFWTPEYWQAYFDSDNPYRQYKSQRDRDLALALTRPLDGERILEVGCGYGRISHALLESAKIRLVGVDLSEPMLRSCRRALASNFVACHADAEQLPFKDGSFDTVVCTGVLMHLKDQRVALAELSRVLRPGGRLVVSGNNLLSPFALPVIVWTLLKSRVRQVFKPPWFYLRNLAKLGIEVRRIMGDTILAVGLTLPGLGLSLLLPVLFPALRVLDRWADRAPLNYLTYETWFLGVKLR